MQHACFDGVLSSPVKPAVQGSQERGDQSASSLWITIKDLSEGKPSSLNSICDAILFRSQLFNLNACCKVQPGCNTCLLLSLQQQTVDLMFYGPNLQHAQQ